MATSLATLAELVGGRLAGTAGAGDLPIHGAATLEAAEPGQISLVDAADKTHRLSRSRASAIVVPTHYLPEGLAVIQVGDVHRAFARIVRHFRPERPRRRIGVSRLAMVSPTAKLAEDVDVHPGATIGDDVEIGPRATIHSGARIMAGCRIGADATIFCNAVLYEDTIIGPRSVIHAGAVLGAYGFGYKMSDEKHEPTAQLGYVEIGCDVEVGACSTIDRGTYTATVIGDGTKIDNLVMIAHNCRIGRHNLICSQVGVAGSTSTGDHVIMAGQVGVRDHVHIGHRAVLGAKAGVSADVPDGAQMLGTPAVPLKEERRKWVLAARLPEMRQQLLDLQRQVDELQAEKLPPRQSGDQAAA